MKFNITCQGRPIGNDIDIQIDAEGDENISAVTCILDAFEIASDDLSETPVVSFHRTINQAGEGRPGQLHKFVVSRAKRISSGQKYGPI